MIGLLVLKTNWELSYISTLNLIQVNKLLDGITAVEKRINEERENINKGKPTTSTSTKHMTKEELIQDNKKNSKKYIDSVVGAPGFSYKRKVVKRSKRKK